MAYAHDDQRAVHPIIPNRSIGLYFVLSFATLSLYHYWFMQQMVRDVNRICDGDGEQEIPSVGWMLLLSILTLGAYQYLWFAHIADRLYNNAQRYRVDSVHDGETLCLWMILLPGMGAAVAMALMIRDVNHMVRAYYAESIDARSRQKCPTERNSEDGRKACSVPHKKSTSRGNDLALGGFLGLAGNYKNMKIPLQVGEQLVLGRDPKQAGLIIEGQKISRVHCIVQYIGFERGYLVTDCSRNGVQINGRQIEPRIPVKVKCGSKLMLPGGEYVFQFL